MLVAQEKVSIIIPVYNAETYLEQCINSVLAQTYSHIEIILVNDGSTDTSKTICESFCARDERILLLNKENEGAGKARLTGIQQATGTYICFLDSDDRMEPGFVETMVAITEVNHADLAECGYYVFSDGITKNHSVFSQDKVFDKVVFLESVVANTIIDGREAVVLWNKLYRKTLIDTFVKIYTANVLEDYIFNMQYYLGVEKYAYVNEMLIGYRMTENSLTRKYNPDLFDELKKVMPLKEQYMQKYALDGAVYQMRHAAWYLDYLYNYLKGGATSPGFFKQAKRVISDPDTKAAANAAPKHILANDINRNRYTVCAGKIYVVGVAFMVKRSLYRIKQRVKAFIQ